MEEPQSIPETKKNISDRDSQTPPNTRAKEHKLFLFGSRKTLHTPYDTNSTSSLKQTQEATMSVY
eukprot:1592496-Amphidinium_carterae.1